MTTRNPAVINFGTCWSTGNGNDLTMPSVMSTGNRVVAEAILRRWSTSQGQLIDDPNYGYNVMDLVSADLGKKDLAYAQQQLAAEAGKDERVLSASVTVAIDAAGLLSISATITTAAGPFRLVVAVSATSVTLLLVSP